MLTTSVASTSSSPHCAKESRMAVKKIVVGHRADFAAGLTGGLVSVHIRYLVVPSLALARIRDYNGDSRIAEQAPPD